MGHNRQLWGYRRAPRLPPPPSRSPTAASHPPRCHRAGARPCGGRCRWWPGQGCLAAWPPGRLQAAALKSVRPACPGRKGTAKVPAHRDDLSQDSTKSDTESRPPPQPATVCMGSKHLAAVLRCVGRVVEGGSSRVPIAGSQQALAVGVGPQGGVGVDVRDEVAALDLECRGGGLSASRKQSSTGSNCGRCCGCG